jgi:hypothetical protein
MTNDSAQSKKAIVTTAPVVSEVMDVISGSSKDADKNMLYDDDDDMIKNDDSGGISVTTSDKVMWGLH